MTNLTLVPRSVVVNLWLFADEDDRGFRRVVKDSDSCYGQLILLHWGRQFCTGFNCYGRALSPWTFLKPDNALGFIIHLWILYICFHLAKGYHRIKSTSLSAYQPYLLYSECGHSRSFEVTFSAIVSLTCDTACQPLSPTTNDLVPRIHVVIVIFNIWNVWFPQNWICIFYKFGMGEIICIPKEDYWEFYVY